MFSKVTRYLLFKMGTYYGRIHEYEKATKY